VSTPRSVALLLETSNAYSRGLLDGVIAYMKQHGQWSVYLPEQERGASPPDWLKTWRGDGIIARIETRAIATAIRRTKLPVVDVSAGRHLPEVPWVETDDKAIARLAAEHLTSRGFRHLAYCGDPSFNWSVWREAEFQTAVRERGADYHVHQSIPLTSPRYSWNRDRGQLGRWLNRLPRPIGIMACYDIKAQQLLSVCRAEGLRVPEEIAVIGVDNDRRLCELSDPTLSSVAPDTRRAGFEAAAVLSRLMKGQSAGSDRSLILPLGVETRQSTDVLAIDDPVIAEAARFIRDNACRGMNVHDVLQRIPLSRRVLERRFVEAIGRTPHAELLRLRVERARQLLSTTDRSLVAIARQSGFRHAEYFSVAFKRSTGMTPRQYRQQSRVG
jgi:LacI family transcriptional regulator, galactose operon repressor